MAKVWKKNNKSSPIRKIELEAHEISIENTLAETLLTIFRVTKSISINIYDSRRTLRHIQVYKFAIGQHNEIVKHRLRWKYR